MGAHTGRCFRAWRRTKARKQAQGIEWTFPIRQKVPLALRPFLTGEGRQKSAGTNAMNLAITRYAEHQTMIGKQVEAMRRGTARGQ